MDGRVTPRTSNSGIGKNQGWLLKENTKPSACMCVCVRVMFTGGEVEERDFRLGCHGAAESTLTEFSFNPESNMKTLKGMGGGGMGRRVGKKVENSQIRL